MSCKKNKQKLQGKANLVNRRKLLSFFTKNIDQKSDTKIYPFLPHKIITQNTMKKDNKKTVYS